MPLGISRCLYRCPKAKPPSGPVKKDGAVCGTAVAQDMKASKLVNHTNMSGIVKRAISNNVP